MVIKLLFILLGSIIGVMLDDDGIASNEVDVDLWPFRHCPSDDVTDSICRYANCTHARGLNLQQNKYISLNSIRESQPTGYLLKLQLFIRGDSDCHIILSPNNTSAMGTKYDIVIGGYKNRQTYLWKTRMLALAETIDVMPLLVPAEFNIQISKAGEFEIRKGDAVLLRAVDRQPLPIKFIKLGTFEDANLEYFYNCRANENDVKAIDSKPDKANPDAMTSGNRVVVQTASVFNEAALNGGPMRCIFVVLIAFGIVLSGCF